MSELNKGHDKIGHSRSLRSLVVVNLRDYISVLGQPGNIYITNVQER